MKRATATVILDTRRIKADLTYPVKLRVTFERKQKYYPLPFDFSQTKFEQIMYNKRLSESDNILKKKVTAFENKAHDIIQTMPHFSWSLFEKHYTTDRGAKENIASAFEGLILSLKQQGRIGTAVSYDCAARSLSTFRSDLKFTDVTPDLLHKYESWMLQKGNSITSVGIYLRSLRTIVNNAINDGFISKDYYPFGKKKYEIPTSNNIKKALTLKEIGKIYNFKVEEGTYQEMSRDYWLFMYLANGMNVKDMSLLTYDCIKGDVIEFVRAKTARTKRKVEPIRVFLTDDLQKIIAKWGNDIKDGKNFIFNILKKGMSPERQRQIVQQLTGVINDHMKAIAKELGINQTVTTYAARHSFSTVLQRSGISTEFISEALGHTNVKTTANYLAGFEDESKRENAKALTAFIGS